MVDAIDPRPPTRRGLSLRATLILLLLGVCAYVATVALVLADRIVPSATALQGHSAQFAHQYDRIHANAAALRTELRSTDGLLRWARSHQAPAPESLRAGADRVQRWIDDATDVASSGALLSVPTEMRLALARAADAEGEAGSALRESLAEVELGQLDAAGLSLRRADSLLPLIDGDLAVAERYGLLDAAAREQALGQAALAAIRALSAWGLAGVLLLGGSVLLLYRRVYRPLSEIDAGLNRLASGEMETVVPVHRHDELGRLSAHLNETGRLLRLRQEEERREAVNLTERFGRVLDESANEIYVFDAGTLHLVQVNRGAREKLGYDSAELARLTPLDLLPEYDAARFAALVAQLREGRHRRLVFTTVQRRRDGTTYPVEVNLQHSTRESPPVFVAITQDISERLAADEALRASESKFMKIFEGSPDAVVISRLSSGQFIDVNESFERLFGCSRQELIGRTSLELGFWPNAALRSRLVADLRRLGRVRNVEVQLKTRAGDPIIVELSAEIIELGGETCLLAVERDITQRKRDEEALRASESKFTKIFQASPDAMTITELETGRIIEVNHGYQRMLGFSRAEVLGRTMLELGAWVDPRQREEMTRRLHTRGTTGLLEVLIRKKSGEAFTCELSADVIELEGVRYVLSIARDISERWKMEQTRDALQHFAQELSSVVTLVDLGRLLARQSRRLFGHDAFALDLFDAGTDTLAIIYGEDTPLDATAPVLTAPESGIPVGEAVREVLVGVAKLVDRAEAPVDTPWPRFGVKTRLSRCLMFAPIRREGHPLGLLSAQSYTPGRYAEADLELLQLLADQCGGAISRIQAEESLRQSGQRFRALTEGALDLIVLLDAAGNIKFMSPSSERILGYRPEELIGTPAFDLIHPDDRGAALKVFQERLVSSGQFRSVEFRFQHRDGSYRVLESIGRNLLDDPAVAGVVINSRDISERKHLEAQFLQAQKMEAVGRLAGGVAHDFNNLLTAISSYAEFTYESLTPGDPRREDVEEIRNAARRAAGLTRQLLAFARKQVGEPKVVVLNDLVINLDKMLRRMIGSNIELVTIPGARLWPVKIDPGQLEQVLVNLAVNAGDAMSEGGRLVLETSNVLMGDRKAREHPGLIPGSYVMLTVTDTGVGMSPDVLSHLFEPFYTTKGPGKGTGLGLATCYGIIKQSGGYIAVRSQPSQGTTFTIFLPRTEEPAPPVMATTPEPVLPTGHETVLLVEDQAQVLDLAARILRAQGYLVLAAMSGDQALALARAQGGRIGLLLTDMVLPLMSGREIAERLRRDFHDLRVLYMSGYTEHPVTTDGAIDSGAFLAKPFTPAMLARKVREVLDTAPQAAI